MNIHYDFESHLFAIITGIIAWCVIGIIAYWIYKKQTKNPRAWKVLLCIFVGVFSFSINWPLFGTLVRFSILPLGVLILYWVLNRKKGRWQRYRPFAWLGFFANYIFLVASLIAIPIHHVIYPENELTTYIANIEITSIIGIHPSALDHSLDKESLQKQIHSMNQKTVDGQQWYYEELMVDEAASKKNERFPYLLIGTSAKWGSGLETIIYVEADGKGLLVNTSNKQLYFRSKDSLLKGGK